MPGFKVLIVEDDVLVARDLEASLRHLGYEIAAVVYEGGQVLAMIAETAPDLILMDIELSGGQDGIEIAQQIRDRFQIPVVFLTAYSNSTILERVKTTNPFGYVLKPYEIRVLQIVLELAMARRQMELAEQSSRLETAAAPARTALLETRLLTQVFHELLLPLTTIQFAADTLSDRDRRFDRATQQMYLQQIQVATDTIYQLLTACLSLEQLQNTAIAPRRALHSLIDLFQKWVGIIQESTGNRNPIQFFHARQPILAEVDAALIGQLLSQLLSNAIRYSAPHTLVMLTLFADPHYCYFRVRDRGIGVSPDDLPHLFQPFYRGSNVGHLPGAGLGLAIAQRIVDLHGGRLWVKSRLGQGTSLICKLPLQAGDRVSAPPLI